MDAEWVARRKKVTLHRFIAELYVENACTSKFLMERIADVIAIYSRPEEADEALECLCVVLTFVSTSILKYYIEVQVMLKWIRSFKKVVTIFVLLILFLSRLVKN